MLKDGLGGDVVLEGSDQRRVSRDDQTLYECLGGEGGISRPSVKVVGITV